MNTKKCTKCEAIKSFDQFAPYKKHKDGLYSYCRSCVKVLNKIYYLKNVEKEKARTKLYALNHPEWVKSTSTTYHANNQDKERNYRQNNIAKILQNGARWRNNNPNKARAIYSKRRSVKLQAMPKWANQQKIQEFYETADGLNMLTGIWHEVDHIVPLQSKVVCGLHCEANLQILTMSENRTKSNKFCVSSFNSIIQ